MKKSGAEIIIAMLERQGIDVVFGIPGGSNLPLYDALFKSSIRHILTRHEQGAGFMAQGVTRSTGKPAVCFATSGPGAVNLITALADAKMDSIPIIAITGQVPRPFIGKDAFQEIDVFGMTLPIIKHSYLVKSAEDLLRIVPEAFRIAVSGRPGPILIDVPKDVQTEYVEMEAWPEPDDQHYSQQEMVHHSAIDQAAHLILQSHRPVLLAGGGIIHSNASEELGMFARKNNIPIAMTLMGLGTFPSADPLSLGLVGMHGSAATNLVVQEADLIIVCGARFNDRTTGNLTRFCPDAAVIHIDIDPSEINKIRMPDVSFTGDVKVALSQLTSVVQSKSRDIWLGRIRQIQAENPVIYSEDPAHPVNIIRMIQFFLPKDTIITTDVGQHQMWTAQYYSFHTPRMFLTSGGLGTMGFGLPAAIGAALANPEKKVLCFTGDGSLLMNIQELATLADLNLNVTVVVMNNGHLGLVRQQQELFYDGNYVASKFISNPDFSAISRGFGIPGYDLTDHRTKKILNQILQKPGPALINIPIAANENVLPMVPPGGGNAEMIMMKSQKIGELASS